MSNGVSLISGEQHCVHFMVFHVVIKLIAIPLAGNNFQEKKNNGLNSLLSGHVICKYYEYWWCT